MLTEIDVAATLKGKLGGVEFGQVLSEAGDAARLVLVLDSDPLAAPAIGQVDLLQERVDTLLADRLHDGRGPADRQLPDPPRC